MLFPLSAAHHVQAADVRTALSDGPFLIIANPTSGRGRGRAVAEGVEARLRAAGRAVSIQYTSAQGDGERIAADALASAAAPGCIVPCGGDGTVQEVVNAVASAGGKVAVGLAPSGRCNDFGRALGVSNDPAQIADVLLRGTPRSVDLGRVNGRYFCTVATAGVDAEVSEFVDTMRMPLRGTPAYLYGAIRVLAGYKCRLMRIEGDFGVIERPMLLASTANTSSYGGAIQIAPDADPGDGLLDVCYVDQMSRFQAMRLLPTLLSGHHGRRREVHFARTSRLTIHIDPPMTLWADGERITNTPATIEVAPSAVRVMGILP